MNKKTVVKTIGITIAIIIIISCVELLIRKLSDMREKNDNYSSPSQVSETQKQTEEKFIKKVNDVEELLKARDYEKIYERFSNNYKDAKYPTYEEFEKYMNSLIKEDTKIETKEWIKYPYGYYATITLNDGESELPVVLWDLDGECQIMFDNIVSLSKEFYNFIPEENVYLILKYHISYLDKVGYVFEITNSSTNNIKVAIKEAYLYGTTMMTQEKYSIIDKLETTLSVGETKKVEFQFPVIASELFPPTIMKLIYTINGRTYEEKIDISFEEEYYEDGLWVD